TVNGAARGTGPVRHPPSVATADAPRPREGGRTNPRREGRHRGAACVGNREPGDLPGSAAPEAPASAEGLLSSEEESGRRTMGGWRWARACLGPALSVASMAWGQSTAVELPPVDVPVPAAAPPPPESPLVRDPTGFTTVVDVESRHAEIPTVGS